MNNKHVTFIFIGSTNGLELIAIVFLPAIVSETYDNAWRLYNPYCKPLQRESQFLFCKFGHINKTVLKRRNGYTIRLWRYWRIIYVLLLLIAALLIVIQWEVVPSLNAELIGNLI